MQWPPLPVWHRMSPLLWIQNTQWIYNNILFIFCNNIVYWLVYPYMGNCAWSMPGRWSSTLLWFHRRLQWCFWVAVRELPIHCQTDWLQSPIHCRTAIYIPPGSAIRRQSQVQHQTFLSSQAFLTRKIQHNKGNPYLFKYFTTGLNLILFTQNIAGAETLCVSKALDSMLKKLIQGVLAWEVFPGQGVKVVDRAVRSLGTAWSRTSLYPLGQSFSLPSTGDIVPGQEGKDGIQPYQEVDWKEEDRLECWVCLETHAVLWESMWGREVSSSSGHSSSMWYDGPKDVWCTQRRLCKIGGLRKRIPPRTDNFKSPTTVVLNY